MASRSNHSLVVDMIIKAERYYAWREVRNRIPASQPALLQPRLLMGQCVVGVILSSALMGRVLVSAVIMVPLACAAPFRK